MTGTASSEFDILVPSPSASGRGSEGARRLDEAIDELESARRSGGSTALLESRVVQHMPRSGKYARRGRVYEVVDGELVVSNAYNANSNAEIRQSISLFTGLLLALAFGGLLAILSGLLSALQVLVIAAISVSIAAWALFRTGPDDEA